MMKRNLLSRTLLLLLMVVGGVCGAWAEEPDVTITFASPVSLSEGSLSDFSNDNNNLTLTTSQNDAASAPAISSSQLRLYSNKNGGNGCSMTLSSANKNFAKVVFTFSGSSYTGGDNAISSGYSVSGSTGTWTGSAKSITMQNKNTSNDQIRISRIEVFYESAGSTWSVTYNSNGATSGDVPTDATEYDADNCNVTVLGNTGSLAKTGYTFDGWNTKADGSGDDYAAGDNFTISANTTLYAKWEANTWSVTLPNANTYGTYTMDLTNPVAVDAEVTLTYTPASGYENYKATWSVNGTAISGNKFTMPNEAVTVTVDVEEAIDYVELPFNYDGGTKSDLTSVNGISANGLGDDYAASNAPYRVKFDNVGDYILIKTDSQPGKVTIGVKMIGGGSTSKITVKGSADGENFTSVQELTISGSQNDELSLETTNQFAATDRYVKIEFTEKGSNVGVGPISIALPTTDPEIIADNEVELTAEETSGEIAFTINNPVSGTSLTASSEDDWISNVTVDSDNSKVTFTTSANTGAAREGTITLTYGTLTKDVTVIQKKPAAQAVDGVFDFSFADEIDYGTGMQPTNTDIKEATTFTAGNVTLVAEPTATNKYFRWYSDGTLRFYTDTKMTISVPNGYVITKIDFEGTQNLDAISADPGTYEAASSKKAATWTGAAQRVELVRNGSNPFFTMITVAYTEATQSISFSKEYISYCSPYALDFTNVEGLEALVVTKINETSVSTEAVTTVPAGEGVILHKTGTATSFNVPVAATATAHAANKLVGVLEDTEIGGNGTDYVLKDGKFMKANAGTLAAGKAYLKTDVNAAPALTIGFGDEGTTGIRSIDNGQLTIDNVYYDLSGRRVAEPTKGVYIVNGKKVVIK